MKKYDYVASRRAEVKSLPNRGKAGRRFKRSMKLYSRLNVWVYKLSRGRLMNTAMGGYPVCLVDMVGARTGKKRSIPLIHVPYGGDKLLVGSQAGLDTDPAWVNSLRANPQVMITADGVTAHYRAREVSPEEKRQLWPRLLDVYPAYDEYQARTDRDIPVFFCVRV